MSDNGPRKAAHGFCSLSGATALALVELAVLSVLCGLIFFPLGFLCGLVLFGAGSK